jgi:hypothetical protein
MGVAAMGPYRWRTLVQREMRARLIVIGKIRGQDLPQMLPAENKNLTTI